MGRSEDCKTERMAGHRWNQKREKVLERDGHTCSNCGSESDLEIHHIVPVSKGGSNELANLVTLCSDCHNSAHGGGPTTTDDASEKSYRWTPSETKMRSVIESEPHPLKKAMLLLLLKTGIGVGELCNLDIDDYAPNSEPIRQEFSLPEQRWAPDSPPAIRIRVAEELPFSVRRERTFETVLPLDSEVAEILRKWLAIRPDPATDDQPLFMKVKDDWGKRMSPSVVHDVVTNRAKELDLFQGSQTDRLTPYTFRAFFDERFQGAPAVRDYILGRIEMPSEWTLDEICAHYRRNVICLQPDSV